MISIRERERRGERERNTREIQGTTMQQLIWAKHQARFRHSYSDASPPQHKSAMHGKKRARSDIPIGTWSVYSGVLTIMGITIAAALAMAPTLL